MSTNLSNILDNHDYKLFTDYLIQIIKVNSVKFLFLWLSFFFIFGSILENRVINQTHP